MIPAEHCVATFHATYAVLRAEKLLKGLGLPVKMVPVPRQISSNCGIAIRIECQDLDRLRAAVTPFADDLEGFWRRDVAGAYHRLEGPA